MTNTTLRKLLLAVSVGLLLMLHVPTSSLAQQAGRTTPAPIELKGIIIEYAVPDATGDLVWKTPEPGKPNVIPAASERLRFKATVTNRQPGARIKLRGLFQELCPSPDPGKKFLSKMKHLTETDPGNVTADPADDEEQVIKPDGTVAIEIVVHCETCGAVECGKRCGQHRDHLGEGPHVLGVTATDAPPPARPESGGSARHAETTGAKPSSFRVDLMSVCPEHSKPRGGRTTTLRRGAR